MLLSDDTCPNTAREQTHICVKKKNKNKKKTLAPKNKSDPVAGGTKQYTPQLGTEWEARDGYRERGERATRRWREHNGLDAEG